MRARYKKRKISYILILSLMILALAGCGGGNEPSPEWSSERMGRSNPFDIPEDYDRSEKKSSHTSSYLVPMTIEQLIERSVLVMRGRGAWI